MSTAEAAPPFAIFEGWRRSKKIALIESKNPRWADLAETWGAQMAFAGESIKGR
jgi:predicted GIY-YIG superfamily endonuclease